MYQNHGTASILVSSAVHNAHSNRYIIVLQNAILINCDNENRTLTIEIDERSVTLRSTTFSSKKSRLTRALSSRFAQLSVENETFFPENVNEHKNENVNSAMPSPIFAPKSTLLKHRFSSYFANKSDMSLAKPQNNIKNPNHDRSTSTDSYTYIFNKTQSDMILFSLLSPTTAVLSPLAPIFDTELPIELPNCNNESPISKKVSQIRELLCIANVSIRDIAVAMSETYLTHYCIVNDGIDSSISEDIRCVSRNNRKYAMKTIPFRNIHSLKSHLQRFVSIYDNGFMELQDIMIATTNIQMISRYYQRTLIEYLVHSADGLHCKNYKSLIRELVIELNAMHCKGYVHHDLKPSNIMFDCNDNLHLIDFDFMSAVGDVIRTKGTMGFIAPEMFGTLFDNNCDLRSHTNMDMWSLANVICFMLFRGRIPFSYSDLDLKKYCQFHSLRDEQDYREKKWNFIVDAKLDFDQFYDDNVFRLISDLLSFNPIHRPNCDMIMHDNQYEWLHQTTD